MGRICESEARRCAAGWRHESWHESDTLPESGNEERWYRLEPTIRRLALKPFQFDRTEPPFACRFGRFGRFGPRGAKPYRGRVEIVSGFWSDR